MPVVALVVSVGDGGNMDNRLAVDTYRETLEELAFRLEEEAVDTDRKERVDSLAEEEVDRKVAMVVAVVATWQAEVAWTELVSWQL